MRKILAAALLSVFFMGFSFGFSNDAHAFIRLSLLGGVESTSLRGYKDGAQNTLGFEGGLGVELKLWRIGLELDALWARRDTSYSFDSKNIAFGNLRETADYNGSALVVPLLARLWILDGLSFGLGPYFSQFIGSLDYSAGIKGPKDAIPKTIYLRTEGSGPSSDYNRKSYDYGGTASVLWGTDFSSKGPVGNFFYLDFRYSRSIQNVTANTLTNGISHFSVFEILFGVGPRL